MLFQNFCQNILLYLIDINLKKKFVKNGKSLWVLDASQTVFWKKNYPLIIHLKDHHLTILTHCQVLNVQY